MRNLMRILAAHNFFVDGDFVAAEQPQLEPWRGTPRSSSPVDRRSTRPWHTTAGATLHGVVFRIFG
jgi:hypothetical protein